MRVVGRSIQAVLGVAFGCLALAVPVAGESPGRVGDDPLGVPLRMRDFTFPSHLYLGFTPAPAAPLGRGTRAIEVHWSKVNDFQVSPAVEDYLAATRAPGDRLPLTAEDAAAILALPDGDSFYVDGEYDYL